jgi:hypothetical protein
MKSLSRKLKNTLKGKDIGMNKGEFRPLEETTETDREKAVRRVADAVHRVNEAIIRAVDAGISVELVRTSRFHDGTGNWGDQMIPMIREAAATEKA